MSREQLTESAFIQSISENQYIRQYCSEHNPPVSFSEIYDHYQSGYRSIDNVRDKEDMEIFSSFMKTNDRANDFVIQDYSSFGEDKGHSVLVTANKDVYVAFDGTNAREWIDDGVGMYSESTPQQVAAANKYDDYVRAFGFTEDNNIVVTGHSKGGNKAMFVTMESQYANLIDKCVALDGQGFSPEAIDHWHEMYDDSTYQDRVDKITLVAGKNDYVHQLGIGIAKDIYTIDYTEWTDAKGIDGTLASYHAHEWMFAYDANHNLTLNGPSRPDKIDGLLTQFMNEYMKLSREDREKSAYKLMRIVQMIVTGEINSYDTAKLMKDVDDVLVILAETPSGAVLIRLLSAIVGELGTTSLAFMPWTSLLIQYFATVELRGWYKNLTNKKTTGTPTNNKQTPTKTTGSSSGSTGVSSSSNGSAVATSGSGSDKEIVLNKEAFEDLIPKFEEIFATASGAAQDAYNAEMVEFSAYEKDLAAQQKSIDNEATNIRELINRIIDSLSSTDSKNREEAEKIIGPEIYNAVVSGYNVVCSPNGDYSVKIVYEEALQNYQGLRMHMADNCTNTSLAMMIQRYYLLHYGKCDLVYDDINHNQFYWDVENRAGHMEHSLDGGGRYVADSGLKGDLANCGGGNIQQGLANQLAQHPEGVIIYGPYAKGGAHAVLVTNCDVNPDGTFKFYAIDPAQGYETELTNTSLYSNSNSLKGKYNSVDDMLNNLFDYQYLSYCE